MHYILKDENAVYYECGFSCDNELFLRIGESGYFITDARYTTEAVESIKNAEVIEAGDLYEAARVILRQEGVKRLAYDPKEFSCADLEALEKSRVWLKKEPNLSWKKRRIKTQEEIELIQRSAELNAKAFEDFALFLRKSEGMSEAELLYEAKGYLSQKGRFALSFEPILAFNENAAKPHAYATNKRLHRGDLILFDAGIKYKRYCSDRTRSAFFDSAISFDKNQRFSNPKIQRAYDIVKKAQEAAIAGAKSGMKAKELDRIARDIIEKSEFKGSFIHSLGHGVGLDIHEMPFINQRNEEILEDGMVFTIEPGIYIPGEFGIRIEDMVVMRDGRAEVL